MYPECCAVTQLFGGHASCLCNPLMLHASCQLCLACKQHTALVCCSAVATVCGAHVIHPVLSEQGRCVPVSFCGQHLRNVCL